jgi:hypothetical protein
MGYQEEIGLGVGVLDGLIGRRSTYAIIRAK